MLGDVGKALGLMSIDTDTGYADLTTLLHRELKSIELSSLFAFDRVVFFGEYHSVVAPKDEIIRNLDNFRQVGVTHLAMEMIPESMQPIIDRYYEANEDRDSLLTHLREKWDYYSKGRISEKYLEMVDTAKSCGVKVVGLDIDLLESDPRPKADLITDQNTHWARVIYDLLQKNRDAKVLVYCGGGHIGYSQFTSKANMGLARMGIFSIVVKFIGGDTYAPPVHICVSLDEYLQRAIADQRLENRPFAIAVKQTRDRNADLYIHLPNGLTCLSSPA